MKVLKHIEFKRPWLLFIFLIPVSLLAQDGKFILDGKLGRWNNPAVLVLSYPYEGRQVMDTSELKNGTFRLSGKVKTPVMGYLTLYFNGFNPPAAPTGGRRMFMAGETRGKIWLAPGHTRFDSPDSLIKAVITGSPLNTDQQSLDKMMSSPGLTTSQRAEGEAQFMHTHPNSLVSLMILYYGYGQPDTGGIPDLTVVEPIFNGFPATVRNSPVGKEYRAKLTAWKTTDAGSLAPDFTQPDQNGKPVRLSDFRGKYVLLDFWASWCHPCRGENPNLLSQYQLYKDKNFMILDLSLDGGTMSISPAKARDAWLKAIKEDGTDVFTQVCDLAGYDKNKVRMQYGVLGIPQNYLIDPQGKVIAKNLRGEALNDKLREIFGSGQSLPMDSAARTGKLGNGFTYYIRRNTQPEKRVIFYLANKAGSILETDSQQGLAHFMEHMNFNGTTHFPKNQLVDYLQTVGVRFGADINAYTGFDETVYQLPIPSDKPALLKNGIEIMHDWAQGALLDSVEIDKERGVVLEEERLGKGAHERMQRKFLPVIMNQARYAQRLPIGLDTVLKNFKKAELLGFYKDWYRPDLQALIVVGDIDVDSMEKAVKEKFADLIAPPNEKPRIRYTIPLTGKNQFLVLTDPEQTATTLEVHIKHREPTLRTAMDYRNYLILQLFNEMLRDRISILSNDRSDPPFLRGGAAIDDFVPGIDNYSFSFVAKPGELEKGFKALWRETERIQRYAFTIAELDRAKKDVLNQRESAVLEMKKTYSERFVNEYLQHFLKGTAAPGIAAELQLTNNYLPGITLESLRDFAKEYIRDTDRDILIMAPDKDRSTLPDEAAVNGWINQVKQENISPYQDSVQEKSMLSNEPAPGKIVKTRSLDSIKAVEWILSNGARVILKPTDFSANDISFLAFAPGGYSICPDSDLMAANYATILSIRSGIGNYNTTELERFFKGKGVTIGNSISEFSAEVQGFPAVKDLEDFLRMNYALFTRPRFDTASIKGTIEMLAAPLENKNHDPNEAFYDTVFSVLTNYSPRKKKETAADIRSIDPDKCAKIYKQQFGDASGFTFCFIGQLDTAKLRPLVEKYIASLPATYNSMKPKDLGIHPPAGRITKTVYKGLEQKSNVNLTFNGPYTYNAVNNKLLQALKEIIQIRLIRRLREEESGVYSPSVITAYDKIPEQRYRLRIGFGCAPENVEKLIASALDEVEKLKANGPLDTEIEKFKAEDRNTHALSIKDNGFWINYISTQLLNGEELNEVNAYDEILKQVTPDNIRAAAKKFLSGENFIRIVLMPENKQP